MNGGSGSRAGTRASSGILVAFGIEQGVDAQALLVGERGGQDAPGTTAGATANLGDEPLDRADAGQQDLVAAQPGGRPVDEQARPVVARPAQGIEPAGQPEASPSVEREVVAVALTDQGHVPPALPPLAVAVESGRCCQRELPGHRGEHRRAVHGGIVEEGAQKRTVPSSRREAEPVVVAVEPGDDRAVGFVEVEVAVELLLVGSPA